MINMKKRIFRIAILSLIILLIAFFNNGFGVFGKSQTAFAVGDLTVDWGVLPPGSPIFTVNNMAPGDIESKIVKVKNNATSLRPVGVRGVKTLETGGLSGVLIITISENGTNLYDPLSMAQFFADSSAVDGIFLSDIVPGQEKSYLFKVEFSSSSGNQYQGKNLTADFHIGISVPVPQECKNIVLKGDPIFGTEGNDELKGTNGNDLIYGFEGNDEIMGGNGRDCIIGGTGKDKIIGGNGADVIFGNEGNDEIKGGNSEDKIYGGSGNDTIDAGNGGDYVDSGDGDDVVKASNGEDIVVGGLGKDSINGENGNDKISGGNGDDTIDGGLGNDDINGGDGNDRIKGNLGNDKLVGGPDFDTISGEQGRDFCEGEIENTCEL